MRMGLVLSRKANEAVVYETADGTLTVTVVEIREGKVRLAFLADKSIKILRSELVDVPPAEVKP